MKQKELNLEEIVKKYSGYLYTLIKSKANKATKTEDIEEIIADAFFILWKNQIKVENDKIKPYLASTVKNLLKERARKEDFVYNIENYENNLISKQNINETFEEKEKTKIIEKSLNNMNEEDNKIFTLFYYSGRKIVQIAKELNITEFKVKTKLHRIRKKIKKDLIEGGYGNE